MVAEVGVGRATDAAVGAKTESLGRGVGGVRRRTGIVNCD